MDAILEDLSAIIPRVIAALPAAAAIIIGAIILRALVGRALNLLADRTALTREMVAPFRRLLRTLIGIGAIILIFGVFGFNLGGLWAMLATVLGMVAIGFVAVWSLLSNVSSTVLILFLRPFQIGDDVELAGDPVRGRVVDLNFFFTTLMDSDGNLLQVPNNLFFQKTLRRTRNENPVSLAFQLNSPAPAALPAPAPAPAKDAPAKKAAEPNPLLSVPDPATIMPDKPMR